MERVGLGRAGVPRWAQHGTRGEGLQDRAGETSNELEKKVEGAGVLKNIINYQNTRRTDQREKMRKWKLVTGTAKHWGRADAGIGGTRKTKRVENSKSSRNQGFRGTRGSGVCKLRVFETTLFACVGTGVTGDRGLGSGNDWGTGGPVTGNWDSGGPGVRRDPNTGGLRTRSLVTGQGCRRSGRDWESGGQVSRSWL